MEIVGEPSLAAFAQRAMEQTGVSFCTRNHFGRPQPEEDRAYIRLAYSGITEPRIREGLTLLKDWVESAR